MTAINLADAEAYTSQLTVQKPLPADPSDATTRHFDGAMQKAFAEAASGPSSPPLPDAPNMVPEIHQASLENSKNAAADAQERARRGLGLEAPHSSQNVQGDTILNGLQRIRGFFDVHQATMQSLVTQPAASTATLMTMQMEVTNFSLLCTITSELAGKSTQTFDTLLKGQ